MVATAGGVWTSRFLRSLGRLAIVPPVFAMAFAGYEITLYAATEVLPSSSGAFTLAVIFYILKVNAVAFGGLLVLEYAATRMGLAPPAPVSTAPIPA